MYENNFSCHKVLYKYRISSIYILQKKLLSEANYKSHGMAKSSRPLAIVSYHETISWPQKVVSFVIYNYKQMHIMPSIMLLLVLMSYK